MKRIKQCYSSTCYQRRSLQSSCNGSAPPPPLGWNTPSTSSYIEGMWWWWWGWSCLFTRAWCNAEAPNGCCWCWDMGVYLGPNTSSDDEEVGGIIAWWQSIMEGSSLPFTQLGNWLTAVDEFPIGLYWDVSWAAQSCCCCCCFVKDAGLTCCWGLRNGFPIYCGNGSCCTWKQASTIKKHAIWHPTIFYNSNSRLINWLWIYI